MTDHTPAEAELNQGEPVPPDAVEPGNAPGAGISRRTLIKSALAASLVGGALVAGRSTGASTRRVALAADTPPVKAYSLAGTDGWVSMPVAAHAMPPYFPDNLAPANGNSTGDARMDKFTTYAFGFRNVSDFTPAVRSNADTFMVDTVKNHVQISAPLLYAQAGQDLRLSLFNLGMGNRPDLFDSHTIHFHGFANQIAYFDGVPDASLSVPPGQSLHYRYLPVDAGTYMYHCHVEDVEHVQMGMNGMVFIAPRKGQNYTYDVPGDRTGDPVITTRFDRQFSIHLSEIFPQGHFGDSHIQDTDWTDFTGFFRLMNGRAWPDTIAPHAGTYGNGEVGNPGLVGSITGTSAAANDARRLQFQPLSSLVQGESGEYVLVRISHLGYEQHSIEFPGLPVTIIGQDAKYLGAGRSGYYPDYNYSNNDPGLAPARLPDAPRGNIETTTNRVDLAPGESRDVLIGPLPEVSSMTVFPFYDRNFGYLDGTGNGTDHSTGYGGMRSEIHVHPRNGLTRPTAKELKARVTGADATTLDIHNAVVPNFTTRGNTPTFIDGSPIVQAFPGTLYQAK